MLHIGTAVPTVVIVRNINEKEGLHAVYVCCTCTRLIMQCIVMHGYARTASRAVSYWCCLQLEAIYMDLGDPEFLAWTNQNYFNKRALIG